jgi:UDP-N-acetylglucosamine--N-acetylmuramyl-(pentapeptide) pyrophosphoryl-undecaprenol N-acetylglucosamine transferase
MKANGEGAMRLIVAGGGTGGHFFPGLAVAQALVALSPNASVLFVGGARGIEARLAPRYGFPFRALPASGFAGVGPLKRLAALLRVPVALAKSAGLVFRVKPHAVLGVGGYASVPMGLAAGLLGVPLVLLEQNAFAGLANRLLARFAVLVVVAFPQAAAAFGAKGQPWGNPVREELFRVPPETHGEGPFKLLVFGGSRGAHAINEALASAAPSLAAFPGGVEILHQTGEEDLDRVREAYAAAGVAARVEPFIHDMDEAFAWCHAAVCRAGATTCAELAAVSRPALLVPFPQSAGGHQMANARGMESLGAALCMDQESLTTESLTERLAVLADPAARRAMAGALKHLAHPDAASRTAGALLAAKGATP